MHQPQTTDLLIVGAGPFGLAIAATADAAAVPYVVVGPPMEFWQSHMPAGMLLRSGSDWHLDPLDVDTIDASLQTLPPATAGIQPLSREVYLRYAAWFQQQKGIRSLEMRVQRLDWDPQSGGRFTALTAAGETLVSRWVVLAVGFEYFKVIPEELAAILPVDRYGHTCDVVDLGQYRVERVLIIGGRQSAFEWAALLHEAGAASVELSYRHEPKREASGKSRSPFPMVRRPPWTA